MKFKDVIKKEKILTFYILIYFWCFVLFGVITPLLNNFFINNFLSGYQLVLRGVVFENGV
jgi:hypothetical protein